jgi:hypothetical protein
MRNSSPRRKRSLRVMAAFLYILRNERYTLVVRYVRFYYQCFLRKPSIP